jgi:hypothetical protein
MKKSLKFLILLGALVNGIQAQVILSEGFDGPLSGWTNQGSVVGTQGTVSPHAGGGMAALAVSNILTSSNFSLPTGDKHISFWINEYNASPFGAYSISADLLQNGTSVKNLGTWKDITKWTYIAADYLSAYSGNNFSISFTVQSFIDPNVRFYIDDIKVANGFSEVGVEESSFNGARLAIKQDRTNSKLVLIQASDNTQLLDVEIVEISGKSLMYQYFGNTKTDQNTVLDLTELQDGVYLVKVKSSEGIVFTKLVF